MAGEWREVRFGEIAELNREAISPSDAKGLPYIGLEHIGEGTLALVSTGLAEQATSLIGSDKETSCLVSSGPTSAKSFAPHLTASAPPIFGLCALVKE
jgi:hypothetical protein